MTISVIIPVYNVKPFLERCVQSVLSQTYKNVEIILVDDGSTDGSGELCDDFASRFPVILAIHQVNQGISAARNAGLRCATGQYVVFLDSDDAWLLKDGLEKLVQRADTTKADLVIFKGVHIWKGNRQNKTQDYDIKRIEKLTNCSEIFKYLVKSQQFNMSACFLLVRRMLLINNEILFPIGYISEDVYWSLHLWQFAQKVVILNMDFYGYFHREASVTTSPSIKVYRSYDAIFNYWKSQCDTDCLNADAIRFYLANMWVNRGYGFFRLKKKEQPEALYILQQHTDLLNYGHSPKARRVKWMVKQLGVEMTVRILGWYWQLRNLIKT